MCYRAHQPTSHQASQSAFDISVIRSCGKRLFSRLLSKKGVALDTSLWCRLEFAFPSWKYHTKLNSRKCNKWGVFCTLNVKNTRIGQFAPSGENSRAYFNQWGVTVHSTQDAHPFFLLNIIPGWLEPVLLSKNAPALSKIIQKWLSPSSHRSCECCIIIKLSISTWHLLCRISFGQGHLSVVPEGIIICLNK